MLFDGSADYVSVAHTTNLEPSAAISFGCWAKNTANPSGAQKDLSSLGDHATATDSPTFAESTLKTGRRVR